MEINKIKNFVNVFFTTKKIYILLVAVMVIGAVIRFHGLADREIWYDEALDVLQAEKSLLQITKDVPTPVHYYFVHLFTLFGKNTFVLGLPSVLFGVASIFIVFLIGNKIFNKELGIVSAFLLALSPMHIEFSRQILHYSYFFFLSALSAYLFIKFLLSFEIKPNFIYLWWLMFVNILNILTHVSSFFIIAIEIIYFLFYIFYFQKKHIKIILQKFLSVILFFIALIAVTFFAGKGYYLELFTNSIRFGTHQNQEVGYSLSKQLNSSILTFNANFFKAMFSWFGFGNGYRLVVLVLLSIAGLIFFVRNKKYLETSFLVFWIAYPFLQLYFMSQIHWFEEKYFIFIIPAYLVLIAGGILFFCNLMDVVFSKLITNGRFFYLLFIFLFIAYISILPIKTRTTYGFRIANDESEKYSWKQVYGYLIRNTKQGDRVFVRSGEGIFLDFYYSPKEKNKAWFDESYFFKMNSIDYFKFISDKHNNYFVSIPDLKDMFLSGALDGKQIAKVGGFNIYDVKFKNNPGVPMKNSEGRGGDYYYNFNDARMFSEAYAWNNVGVSYFGNYNLPVSYGQYSLVPTNGYDNYLDYKIELPQEGDKFYIDPMFSIDKDAYFNVSTSYDYKNWVKVFEQKANNFSYFKPSIKIDADKFEKNIFIRLSFLFNDESKIVHNKNKLKSIYIYNSKEYGVSKYDLKKIGMASDYIYDSQLEYKKNTKWKQDSSGNGWVQSDDGILYPDENTKLNPLVYKIDFKNSIKNINLKIKSYTNKNTVEFLYSNNMKSWHQLDKLYNMDIYSSDYLLKNIQNNKLFVKIICKNAGSSCQLRNIEAVAEGNEGDPLNGLTSFEYDSHLESERDYKWINDSMENDGWIQANDGILFIADDYMESKPLIYDFKFPAYIHEISIETKTFTSDNKMTVYYSIDGGQSWESLLETFNKRGELLKHDLKNINSNSIQLKFKCEKIGPTCQVRNVKLKAS